ncbi:hypothetical protein A2U01_0118260, partial [Trifolium medium]|nr:hypothetical protein [Trifolium medium]
GMVAEKSLLGWGAGGEAWAYFLISLCRFGLQIGGSSSQILNKAILSVAHISF